MSTSRGVAGTKDLGLEQYDELLEDWYSDADYNHVSSSSSPSHIRVIASPAYLVIKRQTYQHWEMGQQPSKGQLTDEVYVKLSGRSERPKDDAELDSSVDQTVTKKTTMITDPQIRATEDSTALSTPNTEEEEEPNNINVDARAPPQPADAHSVARDQHAINQLYVSSSPNQQPSLFASFVPPHLPPATQFPPLDPRAQELLSRSSQEAEHDQKQKREREKGKQREQVLPTFSFSRLQMMVADSTARDQSSILGHLTGLHNQVQGSPQSPSLWRFPLEDESEVIPYSARASDDIEDIESSSTSVKATEDDLDTSAADKWPSTGGEELYGLGSVQRAFDYSFVPDCRSSTFYGSSVDEKDERDDGITNSVNGHDFASGSDCTCGHKKHYLRPLQNNADDAATGTDGKDFSFYFRSESRHESSNNNRESPPSHCHFHNHASDHRRRTTDTSAATEDYVESERSSTRANANASNASSLAINDSRTSSELYLSPNFPDTDDRNDHLAGAILFERKGGDERSMGGRDNEHPDTDNHRVYFPTQPGGGIRQREATTTTSSRSLSTLQKLVAATRRRVSSVGEAAFSALSAKQTRPTVNRSTPSAKADLEKSERPWKGRDEPSERKRRVFVKRGRSSTVRHIGSQKAWPSVGSWDRGEQERPNPRRASGRFNFIRRLSQHLGNTSIETSPPQNPVPKGVVAGSTIPTIQQSELHEEPESFLPSVSSSDRNTERRRSRVQSGAAVLFRHFSLAGPKIPSTNTRR